MNTIAYIDGGNLYHGLLRRSPRYKWLDVTALVRSLLSKDHDLADVKYFTARVKTYPHDAAAVERQNVYLSAIEAHGGVKIIEGYYNKNKAWVPSVKAECRECGNGNAVDGYVHVMKMEEKRSDVNLVTELLKDAYAAAAEAFVLVSGDADFIAPLDLIRYQLRRKVVVFNPHERVTDLRFHSTFCMSIPRDLPARCQLPDEIPLPNGRTIHRPPAWA